MKSVALLTFGLLTTCCPAMAKPHHGHYGHYYAARTVHHANLDHHASLARPATVSSEHESHSGITCEMVRAYVAQVGLAQAAAMAESAGATSSDKERARRCLAQKS
jgi:hypothetical protein